MSLSIASTTPTSYPNQEWISKCKSRIDLMARLESGQQMTSADQTAKFETGLPVPSYTALRGTESFKRTCIRARVYLNITNDIEGVLRALSITVLATKKAAECTKLMIHFMEKFPEVTPLSLTQFFAKQTHYTDCCSESLGNLTLIYSLSPDEILSGLTNAELSNVSFHYTSRMGITRDKVAALYAAREGAHTKPKIGACNLL